MGTNSDPFAVYSSWPLTEDCLVSPVRNPKPLEFDSPVLRSGTLVTSGLGIGLLDPFMFPPEESLGDLKEILSSPCSKQDERLNGKRTAPIVTTVDGSPATKKRKITL